MTGVSGREKECEKKKGKEGSNRGRNSFNKG